MQVAQWEFFTEMGEGTDVGAINKIRLIFKNLFLKIMQ